MNILVTGGAGYIGSHTCQELLTAGHHVFCFDNLSYGHLNAIQNIPFIQGDLQNKSLLVQTLTQNKIEAVIHFAAFALVGESTQNPIKYYQNNAMGTLTLLESMLEARVHKLIFSSTCATYGNPHTIPIKENHSTQPVNPYGTSKLFSEQMMREFCRAHHFSCIALRYFNAAGADLKNRIGELHQPETHLIPLTLKAALESDFTLSVFGNDYPTKDGTCLRDYIHVTDLANAHMKALNQFQTGVFDFFNLGTGQGFSVLEIIAAVEKITQKKVKYSIAPRRIGDPPALIADPSKASEILHWTPNHSTIDSIVQTAYAWYQKTKSPDFNWN